MSILFIFIRPLLCGMIQVEQQTEERMIIRFTQDALSYDLQTDENILGGIVEIDSLFYSETYVGLSETQTFTLFNDGSDSLIAALSISDSNFGFWRVGVLISLSQKGECSIS